MQKGWKEKKRQGELQSCRVEAMSKTILFTANLRLTLWHLQSRTSSLFTQKEKLLVR
jgi:hypothetical protein